MSEAHLLVECVARLMYGALQPFHEAALFESGGHADVRGVSLAGERVSGHVQPALGIERGV